MVLSIFSDAVLTVGAADNYTFSGGKLSDVDLPKGFEWVNPNTRFTEQGEHKFDAIYTPNDPNYKSVHVSVTVTVGSM